MCQLSASGADTVYVWIGRTDGDQSQVTRRMLTAAGAALPRRGDSPIVVGRGPSGRPWVRCADVSLPVSVSHVDGVVAVAACRSAPVGVDVERRRRLPALPLAARWFDEASVRWLRRQSPADHPEAFLRLWTAKEAVGKALGVGLRGGGLTRPVPAPERAGPLLRPLPGRHEVRVGHPPAGDELVLAVAVVGNCRPVVVLTDDPTGHEVACRSASGERTSLPVVVRGS